MIPPLSHAEASESLAAAALDALPPVEQEAVLAHAATCPTCGPELATLRDTVASLAAAASPQLPADADARLARARARLQARVGAQRPPARPVPLAVATVPPPAVAAVPAVPLTAPRPVRRPVATWLGLALAASLIGVAVLARNRAALSHALVTARDSVAAVQDSVSALQTARATLAARDELLERLTGPQTVVVSLAASGGPAASALMFWNRASNTWTMYARNMPAPEPGKTYELWLVTPTAKIPAGTFSPSASGTAVVEATYALDPDALRAVAVTEEPAGGVPQPTGPVVIVGQAK